LGSGGNTARVGRFDRGSGFDTLAFEGNGLSFILAPVASPSTANSNNASRISLIARGASDFWAGWRRWFRGKRCLS